jgi:hypothetical protein
MKKTEPDKARRFSDPVEDLRGTILARGLVLGR